MLKKEKELFKKIKQGQDVKTVLSEYLNEDKSDKEEQIEVLMELRNQITSLYNSIIYLSNYDIDNNLLIYHCNSLLREILFKITEITENE